MGDRRLVALLAMAVGVLCFTVAIGWVASSAPSGPASQPVDASGADGFEDLHERGITGSNVSVGIIDVTGFDTDSPAVADQFRAARAFGTGTVDSDASDHGTAAATAVARTAPDADLYLANVGGIDGYVAAVAWLRQQGVDVVVAPVSFYGRPGDGRGAVGSASRAAVEEGTVVVAPSGNLAAGHWRGTYDEASVDERTVAFANDSYQTAIDGPTEVTVWLSWDRAHADEDYTAELYRTDIDGPRLVARSQPYRADETPNERIIADVSPGQYVLVIRGPAEPTGAQLRLVSPTHEFEHARRRGSLVAPGTAPGVLTVGAYNERKESVEPFSSRGPTADGRTGVDVVAPNRQFVGLTENGFVGSSASTPYVGGVVALLLDADPTLRPTRAELLVELTATDIRRPGVDPASGHGVVDPVDAVLAADNRTSADG